MPALPAVPNVFRADLTHDLVADLAATSRLFFKYSGGPPTAADVTSIASDMASTYGSHLAALLPTAFSLTGIVVTDLNLPDGARGEWSGSVPGTRSGTSLTVNTCTVVEHIIARRYRGGKPRNYFPWGLQSDLGSGDSWGSTFLTAVNTDFAAFVANVLAYGSLTITITEHVNVSYYSGFTNYTGSGGRAKVRNSQRATPLVDNITSSAAKQILGSQRRRLRA